MGSEKTGGEFTLLLFASASTYAGGQETLKFPAPTTIKGLFRLLETKFPGMSQKVLSSSAVTVNLDYIDLDIDTDLDLEGLLKEDLPERDANAGEAPGRGLDFRIVQGDEVGIIPPVSSG